jgi:L-fuconolactonase
MRIDAHHHLWQYNRQEYGWIGPGLEALARDFLPADLAPLLAAAGIDGTIVVQARQSLAETQWLLELAGRYPFIKGVVGWVDLQSPDLAEQLARFAPARKLRGVRHVVQDEPDDAFMLRPAFLQGIGLLASFNLAYDILIYPRHLPAACELARRFPNQRFVLDHMAKPCIKAHLLAPWDEGIRRLAAFPNVTCKLSGMITEADPQNWRYEDFVPYLDVVYAAFGPTRLMIGSDWPVCTVAASYEQTLEIVRRYLAQFPAAAQAAVLGENAAWIYQTGEL